MEVTFDKTGTVHDVYEVQPMSQPSKITIREKLLGQI